MPTLVRAGMGDLRQRGAAMPQAGLKVLYAGADQDRMLVVHYFFAAAAAAGWSDLGVERSPEWRAFLGQVRDWAARWCPLVGKSLTGDLAASDVPPDLARLP